MAEKIKDWKMTYINFCTNLNVKLYIWNDQVVIFLSGACYIYVCRFILFYLIKLNQTCNLYLFVNEILSNWLAIYVIYSV